MNSTTSSLRRSCSCCAIGGHPMFCVGMYRVMPLFGMSTLSVLSSQLVCHTQILLPMQVCRINTLKLHVLDKCYFPIDMRLWNCDTRRSPQAENNMIFSGTQPIERVTKDRAPMKVNVLALTRLTRRHRVYFILLCGQTASRAQLGLCALSLAKPS